MGLNKSTGNMYEFVTHTWNTVKGACPHGCEYCYMKRWGKQNPVRFDEKELEEFDRDIEKCGEGQFIFVGSSCDLFADAIPQEWIIKTLKKCNQYNNKYLIQTKNPSRYLWYNDLLSPNFVIGTTIESNIVHPDIMGTTLHPFDRADCLGSVSLTGLKRFITIEPILDFDVVQFADLLNLAHVDWINIGADSGHHNLPEPSPEKIGALISLLNAKITIKRNMKRISPTLRIEK